MTDQENLKLIRLIHELKELIIPIGSLHSYWDVVLDMQEFVLSRPTIVKKNADEWIEYAESLLKRG